MLSNAHAAIRKKTVNERFHTVNAWKRTFKQCWTRRTPPNNCVQDASKSDKPLRGGCPFSRTAMQQHIQTEHTSCSAAGRKSRNARNAYAATLAVATTHQKAALTPCHGTVLQQCLHCRNGFSVTHTSITSRQPVVHAVRHIHNTTHSSHYIALSVNSIRPAPMQV